MNDTTLSRSVSEIKVIPLLNGEQYTTDIRCPDCGKLIARASVILKSDGVLDYDKMKQFVKCSIGVAAPCPSYMCRRKIQEKQIDII